MVRDNAEFSQADDPSQPGDSFEWFDPAQHSAVVALSVVLPERIPLVTARPVLVDDEALSRWGIVSDQVDHRWMRTPMHALMLWHLQETPTSQIEVDARLARDALRLTVNSLGASWPEEPTSAGASDEDSDTRSVAVCVIPVVSEQSALEHEFNRERLDIVTLALHIIAETVRAVRITTGFPVTEITPRMVSPIIAATVAHPDPDRTLRWGVSTALVLGHIENEVATATAPPFAPEVVDQIGYGFKQLAMFRPAAIISDHRERANAAFAAGNLRGAIIDYAITCEVCLNMVLAALYWEAGLSASEAPKLNGKEGIVARVKKYYAPKLKGGSWDVGTCRPLHAWQRDVLEVRNRSVHTGEAPTHEEVVAAQDATKHLLSMLTQRLLSQYRIYPKTIGLLLGRNSIERYGGNQTAKMLALHEQHAQRWEDDYSGWYHQWINLPA